MGKDFKDGCWLFGVWTRLILPLGEFSFDGWLSKDRRVFGIACERFLYVRQ